MKLLSIAIPCYNSQDYMEKCIESVLTGGDEVEIIIVDDGSKDRTAQIADRYEREYPTIVKVIHQKNAGHGGAVNTGIRNATGLYFKVVDSDDWVDQKAYHKILDTLRNLTGGPVVLDLLISNYVYEKQGKKHKKAMSYRTVLPENAIFTWNKVRKFHIGQYMLMHSLIYRTRLLRESGLKLPEHTFYVDNIFAFQPLPYVKTMYYLNVNFYRYFIGREDQSVNEKRMIERIDQQLRVNKIMIDLYCDNRNRNKKLRRYMRNYLEISMTISSVFLILAETEEHDRKKQELWKYLKSKNVKLYYRYSMGIMGGTMKLPGKGGRKISIVAYKVARRYVGFN